MRYINMRWFLAALVIAGAVIAAGCVESTSSTAPTYTRVCRDAQGIVKADHDCERSAPGSGLAWLYLMPRAGGYQLGSPVSGGFLTAPARSRVITNQDAIQRRVVPNPPARVTVPRPLASPRFNSGGSRSFGRAR